MTIILGLLVLVCVFAMHNSLSNRVGRLESKIKNLTQIAPVSNIQPQSKPTVQEVAVAPAESGYFIPSVTPPVTQQEPDTQFVAWLKEDWLMKLGVALFIMGFGWFVSYAFANNWIGPVGRISLGIATGAIIMALGYMRMMKYKSQGAIFLSLGACMAMLSIFAGRSIYGFFDPTSAVAFDFIIAVFVSFASYKFNVRTLAFTAQILAFITPLLVAGKSDSVFLFSYLLFVSLATLLLAGMTGWRALIVSSLVFVGLYSFPYFGYGSGNAEAATILNFAYLFSILYLFSGMFAVVKKGVQDIQTEIALACFNGLFLFTWIYNVVPKNMQVVTFAFWAFVFAISSFIAFYMSTERAPFYAYGSVAIVFLGVATSVQLSGASLVIAYTLEALLITLVVFLLTNNIKSTAAASWLFVIPGLMSFGSVLNYSMSNDLFTKDFFVLVLIAACLIIVGRIVTSYAEKGSAESDGGSVFVIFGIVYFGYIVWRFVHILMIANHDMATMTVLIIYTVVGLIAYFIGLYGNDLARRTYGVILLGFVVFRLLFVDVWGMQLFGRVVTFLAIGILLMSTAFVTKSKRHEIAEAKKLSTTT